MDANTKLAINAFYESERLRHRIEAADSKLKKADSKLKKHVPRIPTEDMALYLQETKLAERTAAARCRICQKTESDLATIQRIEGPES